ncbi:bacteriocin immunity protein [Pseudomonas sp. HMWF021]|uniref:bacteriocin immunity protein n=1 Tax=Pseudomonas sp. HMWF021 TaxID=2056857 RepID=UPI000D390EAC|nr:bacteriocin immunity protein [Pseudomonas sp. HMWF021]PTT32198.1 bacteriocin immunity protein [Pseudomonas sp. HMWF021]
MIFKDNLEDYTEVEFLEFLRALYEERDDMSADDYDAFIIKGVEHFERVTQHPDRSDVIFYPKDGQESTPEGVLRVVKDWLALSDKRGFKSE